MASERKIPDAWVTDKKPSTKDVANSSTVDRGATTACNACGGVVAWGIKACPHCGKKKPAPNPPTNAGPKHLIIACIILVMLIWIMNPTQQTKGGRIDDTQLKEYIQASIVGGNDSPCVRILNYTPVRENVVSVTCGASWQAGANGPQWVYLFDIAKGKVLEAK